MLSLRPMDADDEAIILRRLDVRLSEAACAEAAEKPPSECPDETDAIEACFCGAGGRGFSGGGFWGFSGGASMATAAGWPLTATMDAALALAGSTGRALASAMW